LDDKPFAYQILKFFQYWGKINQDGSLEAVSLEAPISREELCQTPIVDAIGFLHLGSSCIPVKLSFRNKTKTQFMDSIDGMMKKVTKPEWFSKSDHHAGTEAIPQAFARFTTSIRFKRGSSKNGPYCAYEAIHQVVSKERLQALVDTMTNDKLRIGAMVQQFNEHVDKIKKDAGQSA
jgi:hypothetical protein